MLLPSGLICFLHSDLAGNLWGNGVGIHPAKKPNVSGRSNHAQDVGGKMMTKKLI
jgi:hypothetical protein